VLHPIAGRPMPLISSSDGQINAILPFDLPMNTRQHMLVRRGNSISVPESVSIAAAQPAIFTRDQSGKGAGMIIGSPARAGDIVTIYCAGLGAVDPPVPAGTAAPANSLLVNPISVTIGGIAAEVQYAGLTPQSAGLYQINVRVPAGVAPGADVPVIVTIAGQSSPRVTMTVN